MKEKLASAKNFVRRHKVAITVIATATPLIAFQLSTAKTWNKFLEEHGLTETYYHLDEE